MYKTKKIRQPRLLNARQGPKTKVRAKATAGKIRHRSYTSLLSGLSSQSHCPEQPTDLPETSMLEVIQLTLVLISLKVDNIVQKLIFPYTTA